MREIKFRAWDKLGKEMIFPDEIWFNPSSTDLCSKWSVIDRIKGIALSKTDSCNGELMQYTGLKDKNGKEIYEGDVVRYFQGSNRLIKWDETKAKFYIHSNKFLNEDITTNMNLELEIIGNVHNNPELIA